MVYTDLVDEIENVLYLDIAIYSNATVEVIASNMKQKLAAVMNMPMHIYVHGKKLCV